MSVFRTTKSAPYFWFDFVINRRRFHGSTRCTSLPRETPRLCRGGSRSLTFPAIAHRRNSHGACRHALGRKFRDGPVQNVPVNFGAE